MTEMLADYFVELFNGKLPSEVIVFFISMLPVVELRGGMIAAKLLDVELVRAFIICYIGNLIPIPFILRFIRKIFAFLRDKKGFSKIIRKLEESSRDKGKKALRWKGFGLLAFVAIPLPGTGGWTGALVAALMDMRMKISLPLIALGVLIANLIMTAFSYGLLDFIGL